MIKDLNEVIKDLNEGIKQKEDKVKQMTNDFKVLKNSTFYCKRYNKENVRLKVYSKKIMFWDLKYRDLPVKCDGSETRFFIVTFLFHSVKKRVEKRKDSNKVVRL